jgi:hypothetical protein
MSSKPDNQWKEKGLSLAVWGEGETASYQLQKSFKRKGSEEWERQTIRLFHNELENLGGLVMKALGASLSVPEGDYGVATLVGDTYVETQRQSGQPAPAKFDDDDIPF